MGTQIELGLKTVVILCSVNNETENMHVVCFIYLWWVAIILKLN